MISRKESATPRLVLASGSPRRYQLFSALNVSFTVVMSNVREDRLQKIERSPEEMVEIVALSKAVAVRRMVIPDSVIVAADTIVLLDGKVLGKPKSRREAREMLVSLRGKRHQVLTGLALIRPWEDGHLVRHVATIVAMRPYSEREIDEYLASGDPLDKAGAYGVQSLQFHPAAAVEGCYYNVVGLPVCELSQMLHQVGISATPDIGRFASCQSETCPFRAKGARIGNGSNP